MRNEIDYIETTKARLRLFYPVEETDQTRASNVKCEETDDIETVFTRNEQFRAKKTACIDRILFKDAAADIKKTSTVDDKEHKLLLAERNIYTDYLAKSLAGIIPQEVIDPQAFALRAHEKVRKTTKKKKDGEADDKKEEEEDEEKEDIFFSDEEEEDDVRS